MILKLEMVLYQVTRDNHRYCVYYVIRTKDKMLRYKDTQKGQFFKIKILKWINDFRIIHVC